MFKKLDELSDQEIKILIALVSLLLVLMCTMAYMGVKSKEVTLYLDNTAKAPEYNITKVLVPSEGTRTIQLLEDRMTGISMQSVTINNVCKFASGDSPGNVRIENKAGSYRAATVEIVRLDNNQKIMTTGLIDPGYFVEYRKLDVKLEKGTYICVANFTLYDTLSNQVIGKASTQILVVVET